MGGNEKPARDRHRANAHRHAFYHLNLRPACRSTLSDANARRPAAVFRDIAAALIAVAAGALQREGEALIRLLDATAIPVKGDQEESDADARHRIVPKKLLRFAGDESCRAERASIRDRPAASRLNLRIDCRERPSRSARSGLRSSHSRAP